MWLFCSLTMFLWVYTSSLLFHTRAYCSLFLQSFMKHNIYTTVYCLLCACIQMLFYQRIAYKQSHYTCIVFTLTFSHTLFWLELFQCPFIWNVVMNLFICPNFFFFTFHIWRGQSIFCITCTLLFQIYSGREVQNKSRFWKQNNKLQTQMPI